MDPVIVTEPSEPDFYQVALLMLLTLLVIWILSRIARIRSFLKRIFRLVLENRKLIGFVISFFLGNDNISDRGFEGLQEFISALNFEESTTQSVLDASADQLAPILRALNALQNDVEGIKVTLSHLSSSTGSSQDSKMEQSLFPLNQQMSIHSSRIPLTFAGDQMPVELLQLWTQDFRENRTIDVKIFLLREKLYLSLSVRKLAIH